jgi:hypothetical protein
MMKFGFICDDVAIAIFLSFYLLKSFELFLGMLVCVPVVFKERSTDMTETRKQSNAD